MNLRRTHSLFSKAWYLHLCAYILFAFCVACVNVSLLFMVRRIVRHHGKKSSVAWSCRTPEKGFDLEECAVETGWTAGQAGEGGDSASPNFRYQASCIKCFHQSSGCCHPQVRTYRLSRIFSCSSEVLLLRTPRCNCVECENITTDSGSI